MDEYTFIVMAKLKADRLKLQREQRAARRGQNAEAQPINRHRRPMSTRWYSSGPQRREQS